MNSFKKNFTFGSRRAVAVIPITKSELKRQNRLVSNWIKVSNFAAKSGTVCLIPKSDGGLLEVLLGVDSVDDFWAFGNLPTRLPPGTYFIKAKHWTGAQLQNASIAWGLGSYQFTAYKKIPDLAVKLKLAAKVDRAYLENLVKATFLVRDLVNMPAEDMNPQKLSAVVSEIARQFRAKVKQTFGNALKKNYPAIYAVGKSSHNQPRLIELKWGLAKHPKIILVGKGVCFDSGGLSLKPSNAMEHMKKDMAGAADALGLARMIMMAKLPVNLHLIIPAVENLVSSHSYKVGDIIQTHKKMTVEIANTDAEGRLILADALALASEQKPRLIIDFATLTGAATVALGEDVPALFSNNEKIVRKILETALKEKDPIWRMPLYAPYRKRLDSHVADIKNWDSGGKGGAITAALFLQEFVGNDIPWVHLDIEAMNYKNRPGRPIGGEAVCLRTIFEVIKDISCSKFTQ